MDKISKKLKTKASLVRDTAKKHKISLKESKLFVSTVFQEITKALLKDQKVEIRGFGSFYVKKYKAYKGRNPKTQKPVHVGAKQRPIFKAGLISKNLNKSS